MRVLNVLGKKGKKGRGSRASPRPEKAKRSSSSSPLFGSVCFINEELEELRGSVGLLCNFLGPKKHSFGENKVCVFLLDIASFFALESMLQKEDARRIEWILLASFSGVFFLDLPPALKKEKEAWDRGSP